MNVPGGRHGRKNNVPPSHHRIPTEKRQECLKLFEQGYGYKKTAQLAGLNAYTVREYKRKYAAGDNSWAYRGGMTV